MKNELLIVCHAWYTIRNAIDDAQSYFFFVYLRWNNKFVSRASSGLDITISMI